MTTDILILTKAILDLFKEHDLSRVQSIFVIEAAKMSINEEIIRETIEDMRKGYYTSAGIQ